MSLMQDWFDHCQKEDFDEEELLLLFECTFWALQDGDFVCDMQDRLDIHEEPLLSLREKLYEFLNKREEH